MTNSLFDNKDLVEFLDQNDVLDAEDGEVYASSVVTTADNIEDFKKSAAGHGYVETENFDNIKVTTIDRYQCKKGDQRISLFYIDFQNSEQNIVVLS